MVLTEWADRLNLHIFDIHHTLLIGLRFIPVLAEIVLVIATFNDYWPIDPRGQLFNIKHKNIQSLDNSSSQDNVLQTWRMLTQHSLEIFDYYKFSKANHPREELMRDRMWLSLTLFTLTCKCPSMSRFKYGQSIGQSTLAQFPFRRIQIRKHFQGVISQHCTIDCGIQY